jgi:fatty acid synthase subunit alpha
MVESLAKAHATENSKVGVDVENIDAVNIENETFVERNFTTAEQDYCRKAASPQSSFAGRWSAKEAVFKSLGVSSQGAGAALKDIEIGVDATGAPVVNLLGAAAAAAKAAGVKSVNVSISHSETQAVAVAVSKFYFGLIPPPPRI